MKLYTRKSTVSAINIVPMLDILTILLIFFIVHTEFKRQTQVLQLELPQTHSLAGEQGDRNAVLLELGTDGELALAGQRLTNEELPAALRELRAANPQARIQVAAAGGAPMARVINIMDMLNAAGLPAEEIPVRIDYQP